MQKYIKKLISSLLIETQLEGPFVKDLTGKVIVVTGGTGGIGKAICKVLSRKGATVVSVSRYGDNTPGLYSLKVNITKKSEVEKALSAIFKKYGKIDVLVNCAGIVTFKEFGLTTEEDYDEVMDTNVKGVFLMSAGVVVYMKKKKKGLIINIGSKISHNTHVAPKKVLYATSKYAIEGFSLALGRELKKDGIRVTCLMPGTVNTFISFKSRQYLTAENVGFVIAMIIIMEHVDFDSILMKSNAQRL